MSDRPRGTVRRSRVPWRPWVGPFPLAALLLACAPQDNDQTNDAQETLPQTSGQAAEETQAPGPDRDEAAIVHPTGPDQVVLRWTSHAGYRVPEIWESFLAIPSWSLYGDGTVVTAHGMHADAPAWPNLTTLRLSEEGIQRILRAARDVGLMSPRPRFGYTCVQDAGTDVITLDAGGTRREVSAYALDVRETSRDACPEVDWTARRLLRDFQRTLWDLVTLAVEAPVAYVPRALGVYALPYEALSARGYLAPADPEATIPFTWPLAAPLGEPSGRCMLLRGPDVDAVRAAAEGATVVSPWTSGGAKYLVFLRPLLPDESGC